eukprot:scaffold22253_cov54-Cyclotella_meneghiniana.AAC.2
MACLNQGLPIVETDAVERRAGASFLACDCSRKQAGATLSMSKLGGSRSQAVVCPMKRLQQSWSWRQSSNSVTPATVRRGQSGVTFTGRLPRGGENGTPFEPSPNQGNTGDSSGAPAANRPVLNPSRLSLPSPPPLASVDTS